MIRWLRRRQPPSHMSAVSTRLLPRFTAQRYVKVWVGFDLHPPPLSIHKPYKVSLPWLKVFCKGFLSLLIFIASKGKLASDDVYFTNRLENQLFFHCAALSKAILILNYFTHCGEMWQLFFLAQHEVKVLANKINKSFDYFFLSRKFEMLSKKPTGGPVCIQICRGNPVV